VFVDDGDDLDRSAVGGGIELEIDRPYPVGRIGGRCVDRGGRAVAFPAPPLWDTQPFLAPKTLNPLVIHVPAFAAGIVVGGPKTTARMIAGEGAQPCPRRSIRVSRCRRNGRTPLCGAVLPGHPAGEPLTHPQHPLEVVHGRPPAFRA
jgi:hypothetical protein